MWGDAVSRGPKRPRESLWPALAPYWGSKHPPSTSPPEKPLSPPRCPAVTPTQPPDVERRTARQDEEAVAVQQPLLDQIADGAGECHAASKIVRVLEQLAGECRERQ